MDRTDKMDIIYSENSTHFSQNSVGTTHTLPDVLGWSWAMSAPVASHAFTRRQEVEAVLRANLFTE